MRLSFGVLGVAPALVAQYDGCDWLFRQVTLPRSPGRGFMPCSKYLLLQKRYEEAILSWAQAMASQLFGQPSLRSMQARQRALDAKNEAKDRLNVHELSCSICLRKVGPVISAAKNVLGSRAVLASASVDTRGRFRLPRVTRAPTL